MWHRGYRKPLIYFGKSAFKTLHLTTKAVRCYPGSMGGKISALVLLLVSSNLWAAKLWNPTVEFSSRAIRFAPAKAHTLVGQAKLEILETEGCEAKIQSSNLLQFSETCQFLRGYYSYPVKVEGTEHKATVFSEFLLRQTNPKSYLRMINSPTFIFEG